MSTTDASDPDDPSESTLVHHLSHLAADADDIAAFFTRPHEDGELHYDESVKAERLSASLKDVIATLHENEHLAMSSSDIWAMLTRKHRDHKPGTLS